ncbi:hypothetical protein Y026_5019 [Burkholderia pseudomallei TSV28]|nr:hypothetical protein Y026_5019 [Burkholderia pseudomallei TSV28]
MKIKEGVMGPTGVPLMGELRKNLFTRRLKSCQTVYTTIRFDGQSSSIMSQGFCLVSPILELTKLANVMDFL